MEVIRQLCPAKVNLYLKVLGRRPDGYHDLVTVMQPLSLADELTLAPAGTGITLDCDHPELLRGEENLVWRAALGFAEETGMAVGVHFYLKKRIPLAAGLGGGSSDAAGALLGLNRLAGGPLDRSGLHRLAGRLGADVPFFLCGGPAVGRGIGTRLTPLALPPYWYLLLNPGVPLSTRWVYENLNLHEVRRFPEIEDWNPDHPERWVHNDLQTVALKRFPELGTFLEQLKRLKAWTQGISGSGPTIFGLFATLESAQIAARELRRTFSGWMILCRGLTGQATDALWENRTWTI